MVSIESKEAKEDHNPKKHGKKEKVEFIKMRTITSLTKESIKKDVDEMLEKNTKINSDKSNSYNDLSPDYNLNSQVIKKSIEDGNTNRN